jgi:hypothetical protein
MSDQAYRSGVLDLTVAIEVGLRKIVFVGAAYHPISESPSTLCPKFLQVELHAIELDRDRSCRGQLKHWWRTPELSRLTWSVSR